MERVKKRIGIIAIVGLSCLSLLGCQGHTTALKTVELPDSVRYVQLDKDQPYALLWNSGEFNLWRRVDTHSSPYGYPPQSVPLIASVVYRGRLGQGGIIQGIHTDAKVDSGTFLGGDFYLQERFDTLEGRCSVSFLIPTGVYEDTLHLIMVRQ